MDSATSIRINEWLTGPVDEATKKEILHLQHENPRALEDAFSTSLEFGTGGLRALTGIGTRRMNIYTVSLATQGLANYLKCQQKGSLRVCIGHDSRIHSREFALAASQVLAGNGIEVLLTKELRPTPFVSFCTKTYGCNAGIMITASHNPSTYNGYKVYWSDGAQVVAPHDKGIIDEVRKVKLDMVKKSESSSPLITLTTKKEDADYLSTVRKTALLDKDVARSGSKLSIVYTPLHGCGITLLPEALAMWGFTSLSLVPSQSTPDGRFPGAPSPNPEEEKALAAGTSQMLTDHADILLATDPDADRLGIVANHRGKAIRFSGNQIAALLLDFLLTSKEKKGRLSEKDAAISTIVSSRMIKTIAHAHHISYFDVLTGFKYIGEKIHEWELDSSYTFLFGAEESYGYLLSTHARDKDAISAACTIAECALEAKLSGMTLYDKLLSLYEKYGFFYEAQLSKEYPASEESMQAMKKRLADLRKDPPKQIGNYTISSSIDYIDGTRDLPPADVLSFSFENNATILIRPSGTEPKIKLYGLIQSSKKGSAEETLHTLQTELHALLVECKERLLS